MRIRTKFPNKQIRWGEIDKEFIAHMEEIDRKMARAYQRDIALEEADNYSNIMINYEERRGKDGKYQ